MSRKKKIGRPPKKAKKINRARTVGRWTDEKWQPIRDAAEADGVDVAAWCKRVLIDAAGA